MSSTTANTPINQQTVPQETYVYIDPNVEKTPKTYEFIVDGETIPITGHDMENESGLDVETILICPLDKDDHSMSDKNAKALKKLDQALYDTTYNFFHEDPSEAAVKILDEKENGVKYHYLKDNASLIIQQLVRDGYLPKTSANCGNLFKVVSLDAKLRSGERIINSKIKGTDVVLENGLFIRGLIIRNRIRIKHCVLQVDNWKVLCDSNDSFMMAIESNDGYNLNLQPDTRTLYQLKALKERAEFIETDIDLEFESGSIKLDDKTFIMFKDGFITMINTDKGKKKTVSPFKLVAHLDNPDYAPEILFNPDGLLKKGSNNNFITIKYNQKRHDLSTIEGIRNRIIQTLEEAYNKNLKKDINKLISLVRAINDFTEDIDHIMRPWTQVRQSQEVNPDNKPNKKVETDAAGDMEDVDAKIAEEFTKLEDED